MIREYIKMKKAEFRIKMMFYGAISEMADSFSEYKPVITKIFDFTKNYQGEDFRADFVKELAEVIHYDVHGNE